MGTPGMERRGRPGTVWDAGGCSEGVSPAAPDPPCLLGHLCFPAGLASPVEAKLGSNPVRSAGGSSPDGCWPQALAPCGDRDAIPRVRGYPWVGGVPRSHTHSLSPMSRCSWVACLSHTSLRGTERMLRCDEVQKSGIHR